MFPMVLPSPPPRRMSPPADRPRADRTEQCRWARGGGYQAVASGPSRMNHFLCQLISPTDERDRRTVALCREGGHGRLRSTLRLSARRGRSPIRGNIPPEELTRLRARAFPPAEGTQPPRPFFSDLIDLHLLKEFGMGSIRVCGGVVSPPFSAFFCSPESWTPEGGVGKKSPDHGPRQYCGEGASQQSF